MFMNGHDGYIQAEKNKILTQEGEDILSLPPRYPDRSEPEESGESGFE